MKSEGITGAPVWITDEAANLALQAARETWRYRQNASDAICAGVRAISLVGLSGFNETEARIWVTRAAFPSLPPREPAPEPDRVFPSGMQIVGEAARPQPQAKQSESTANGFAERVADAKDSTEDTWMFLDAVVRSRKWWILFGSAAALLFVALLFGPRLFPQAIYGTWVSSTWVSGNGTPKVTLTVYEDNTVMLVFRNEQNKNIVSSPGRLVRIAHGKYKLELREEGTEFFCGAEVTPSGLRLMC